MRGISVLGIALLLSLSSSRGQDPEEATYVSLLKSADRPADPSFVPTVLKVAQFYSAKHQFQKAADVLSTAHQEQMHAFIDVRQRVPILQHLELALWSMGNQQKDAEVLSQLAAIASSVDGPNSKLEARYLIESAIALEKAADVDGAADAELHAAGILRNLYGADSYAAKSAFRKYARLRGESERREQPPQIFEGAYRVSEGATSPKLLHRIDPLYTETAKHDGLQGTVVLKVVVSEPGMVDDVVVLRPLGSGLDGAAIDAVRRWEFAPGMKDGKPVGVIANVEVNFHLH